MHLTKVYTSTWAGLTSERTFGLMTRTFEKLSCCFVWNFLPEEFNTLNTLECMCILLLIYRNILFLIYCYIILLIYWNIIFLIYWNIHPNNVILLLQKYMPPSILKYISWDQIDSHYSANQFRILRLENEKSSPVGPLSFKSSLISFIHLHPCAVFFEARLYSISDLRSRVSGILKMCPNN